jgi:hypothetical protein
MGVIPEGRLKTELTDELVTIEKELAKLNDQKDGLKGQIKNLKGREKTKRDRLDEVLAMLDGRAGLQPPLPLGTQAPKGGPKKVSVEPLLWSRAGDKLVAVTGIGSYRIESRKGPGFEVIWATGDRKTTRLGEEPTESKARELAEKDWLLKAGNQVLENAGSGALLSESERKEAAKARKAKGKPGDDAIDVTPRKALPPKKGEA